jgi:hypothetical protein
MKTLPPGVSAVGNEPGWQMALAKLAELVEADWGSSQEYAFYFGGCI